MNCRGVPTGYKFLGWDYVNHAEQPSVVVRSPLVLGDEDIDLYAVWGIDVGQTRDVTYTVRYTIGGVEVAEDTYTVTKKVWINDPADVTVSVDEISAANNRYENCELDTDPFVAPETAQHGDVITVAYVKTYTVTFLPGDHGDFDVKTETGLRYDDDMPAPPHPYAEFSYNFLGWRDDKGNFYEAPDYRKPNEIIGFPEFVTGTVTFTAEWDEIDSSMTFPDKIPSEQHFDRWWGDYGIICFAASTTKDNDYTIIFADWFFDVFKTCTIGFGAPDKMDYEIRFTEDGTTLWQKTGNTWKQITNKGDIPYQYAMTCVRGGHYFTKDKNHNYGFDFGMDGTLTGVTFTNPFGSGAKLAWLY